MHNIIHQCSINELKNFIECETGTSFTGKLVKCFSHNDNKPSMGITERYGGKAFVKCFSCNYKGDILDVCKYIKSISSDVEAARYLVDNNYLSSSDIKITKKETHHDAPSVAKQLKGLSYYDGHYVYRDTDGNVSYKVRKKFVDGKSFEWFSLDKSNGLIKKGKGDIKFAIYNYSCIGNDCTLYIVEGEKDVDTAKKFKIDAIHIESGSYGSCPALLKKRKHIRILMDKDKAGDDLAKRLSKELIKSKLFTKNEKEAQKLSICLIESGDYPFWFDDKHDLTDTADMCEEGGLNLFLEYIAFNKKDIKTKSLFNDLGFEATEDSITNNQSFRFKRVFKDEISREKANFILISNFLKDSGSRSLVKSAMDLVPRKNILKDRSISEASKYSLSQAHKILDDYLDDCILFKDPELSKRIIKTMILASYAKLHDEALVVPMVLAIVGSQQVGKSKFADSITGKESANTMNGKYTGSPPKISENIRGIDNLNKFFLRLEEYKSFSDTSIDTIKSLTSIRKKNLRKAYSREDTEYVIYANIIITTNNKDILRDPTGDKRIFPVEVDDSDGSNNIERSKVSENMCPDTIMGCATRIILDEPFDVREVHKLKAECSKKHDAEFSVSYIADLLKDNHYPNTTKIYNNEEFLFILKQIINDSRDVEGIKKGAESEMLSNPRNVLQRHMNNIVNRLELDGTIYRYKSSINMINSEGKEYVARKVWVLPFLGFPYMYKSDKGIYKHLKSEFCKNSKLKSTCFSEF